MGVITSAVIGAVSAYGSYKSQKDAASKSRKSANYAADQQYKFLNEGRSLVEDYTQPYRDAGANAVGAMQGMLGLGGQSYDVQEDPGYQFRFGEGVRAMDASASSRGGLLSGGAGRELTRFGQDMASQEYMNIFQRLQALAGGGIQAANIASNAAMNTATGNAQTAGDLGANVASSYVAEGNATAGLFSDLGVAADGLANNWPGGKKPEGGQSRDTGSYGPVGPPAPPSSQTLPPWRTV